ncbi:MAG: cation diffusion facilitator family transporter [Verrucomicrobiae bacterium]|nr:cation diffusion facilitator family transporter [Verrucomicrobiae bacterium]
MTRYAWLSIGAAGVTIGLKTSAFFITGSIGLLSDALESLVNLAGAIMALIVLAIAARPPDEDHAYGHGKAEYFSSGAEGTMIVVAAVSIAAAALNRLLFPQPLQDLGLGLVISVVASGINLAVALVLGRAGRTHRSITLEANASHLMTDVWTSVAVLVGVGAVGLSGWQWLDPVIAMAMAINIMRTGWLIVRRSILGLMDTALPAEDQKLIQEVLAPYRERGLQFHALRTRQSGARQFVSMHVLVPGTWTVQQGHDWLEKLEADLRARLPAATVFTHLEPIEDPCSWEDTHLERTSTTANSTAEAPPAPSI